MYLMLCNTSPDQIAQALCGGLGVDIAEVDHPIHPIHSSEVRGERQVGGYWRLEVALTLNGQRGTGLQLLEQLAQQPIEIWGHRHIDPCHSRCASLPRSAP